MKPKTDVVMADIIEQIKDKFPFDMSEEEMCADTCAYGCPRNLLEYMHAEITDWEARLDNGETPNLQDIQKISKTGRKIYKVLQKNDLVASDEKE